MVATPVLVLLLLLLLQLLLLQLCGYYLLLARDLVDRDR
jgi:hypothetical protein